MKIGKYILIIGLILCAFLSSSITRDPTLTIRHIAWSVITLVLFLLIITRALGEKGSDFGILKRFIFLAFLGYLVMAIFSLCFAVNRSESLYEVLKITTMLIYLFCAALLIREEKDVRLVAKTVILIAIAMGIYGVYQYFTLIVGRRVGLMSGRNMLSAAFLLTLPFSVYGLKFWKLPAIAAIILALFNIITLLTRSVWAALAVSIVVYTCLKSPRLVVIVVLSFIALILLSYTAKDRLPEQFRNMQSVNERLFLWSNTMKMSGAKPLGVGAGNWQLTIPEYAKHDGSLVKRGLAFVEVYFLRAHNDFIEVFSETSIIGFAFYILIFSTALYYSYKTNAVFCAGIAGYMTFAFFSFPKERAFHSMILMLFAAIGISSYHRIKPLFYCVKNKRLIYVVSVFILGLLSFALVDFYFRYDTERYVKRMMDCRNQRDFKGMLSEIDNYSWFSSLDPESLPVYWFRAEAFYKLGDTDKALEYFKKAGRYNPNHPNVLHNIGCCYAIAGDIDKAMFYYEKVLMMCPEYTVARANLKKVLARAK